MNKDVTTLGIFLVGGLGSRLRSMVSEVPKPMAPVQNRPFLEILVKYWISEGVEKFIFLVGYKSENIQKYFGSQFEGKEIVYLNEDALLGTGGALLNCHRQLNIKQPFLLLNGDTFFKISNKALTKFSRENKADWCLSLFKTKIQGRYLTTNINKKYELDFNTNKTNSCWANGGVYLINPSALDAYNFSNDSLSLEKDLLPQSQYLNQKLFGYKSDGFFIDIGLPEDYKNAQLINFNEKLQ